MLKTLFEKLWTLHEISIIGNGECLIFIDRMFLHERTGSIALKGLADAARAIKSPQHVFCTMDHIVDTTLGRGDETLMPNGRDFIVATRKSAQRAGIRLFDIGDQNQGISHVVSAELGIALPGSTLICPDSHTCTLGGLGALAWGVGSTEAEHAMATNTLRVKKPKTMRVDFRGKLSQGVTAKDMILHLISQEGTGGGAGYAVEFSGQTVRELGIEARFTLCNMAVEFSAFTGLVAVDQSTLDYIQDRTFAPKGNELKQAIKHWNTLHTDIGAEFDRTITIQCEEIKPTVTWGTSPQHAISIEDEIPDPKRETSSITANAMTRALTYMDLSPGMPMTSVKLDAAFIGSCTNARLSDLRAAAQYLQGKTVSPWVRAVCVPGSSQVKVAAEAEGLDKIFLAAGFEWRESGCSMCFYAGGETFGKQKRIISTTNRNFEGRQGPETRTHLASPLTVAASACKGYISAAED